jgi:hypothetical protein
MKRNKKNKQENKKPHHEYPLPGEINPVQRQRNTNAHQEAEKDMLNDADLTGQSPNDDLDEGETARLGEDHTDLV